MAKTKPPAADPKAPHFDPLNPPDYVERSHQVLAVEREQYLKRRRENNGLPPPADDNLAGLCISGGGVRSATLGLGLLQAFIKKGILKKFDYLSTVSGGGYIGSCLSSLMSREPNNLEKFGAKPNPNRRFKAEDVGLNEADSPFVGLRYDYEYQTLEKTKLSAKHQLLHLRRYGEYLTPRKGIFTWDVSRAVGALMAGIVIHVILFLLILATVVLLHHALFAGLSGGNFIDHLQAPQLVYNTDHPGDHVSAAYYLPEAEWKKKNTLEQLDAWWQNQLYPQFYLILRTVRTQSTLLLSFMALGLFAGWAFTMYARQLPRRIASTEQAESTYHDPESDRMLERPGGEDLLRHMGRPFVRRFTEVAYGLGPLLAYIVAICLAQKGLLPGLDYFVMLALPLSFSLGLFASVHVAISLVFINTQERVSGRLYRSFYTGMQGASVLGLLLALLFPVVTILLFGGHELVVKLLFSFVPVAVAYYFTMQSLGSRSDGKNWLGALVRQLQTPLLNLSILLFVGLALAWVSNRLMYVEQLINGATHSPIITACLMLACSIALVLLLGFTANTNDISLHYFYRDRLSEAYLRTDGRVARPDVKIPEKPGGPPVRVQSKELFDVNLRNHENLRLANLGEDNFKGPYHLIVSALNLQGSHDLAKKTLKSDHFIFSKYFIGSRTTGYARTDRYRGGGTKLNTAMAISAAAVASGMGLMSFAASNFYMTLLNLRTGYWIENPWYLHKEAREDALIRQGIKVKRTVYERLTRFMKRYPFWLLYLLREFTGKLGADTSRVYVSDGGHTGDNLGLLPLVQRRCRTIVIADFEEDGHYSFGSFNQAVRLSKAIYNADIEIDLNPLLPKQSDGGLLFSPASVAVGKISYPPTRDLPALEGQLVYLKSSVSLLHEVSITSERDAPPPLTEPAPVFVLNYFKNNPAFPHQSTADQYFDEIQFEAYRMLGEHIGKQAAGRVRF